MFKYLKSVLTIVLLLVLIIIPNVSFADWRVSPGPIDSYNEEYIKVDRLYAIAGQESIRIRFVSEVYDNGGGAATIWTTPGCSYCGWYLSQGTTTESYYSTTTGLSKSKIDIIHGYVDSRNMAIRTFEDVTFSQATPGTYNIFAGVKSWLPNNGESQTPGYRLMGAVYFVSSIEEIPLEFRNPPPGDAVPTTIPKYVAPKTPSKVISGTGTKPKIAVPTPSLTPPAKPLAEELIINKSLAKDKKRMFENTESISFSGKTVPNGKVRLYFHSEPFEDEVIADKDGNWSYDLKKDLGLGKHTLSIAVTDVATGLSSEKSEPIDFTVIKLKGLSPSPPINNPEIPKYFYYLVYAIILLSLSMELLIFKNKRLFRK